MMLSSRVLHFVSSAALMVLLGACQSGLSKTEMANVGENLKEVDISLPPRDPFAGYKNVPKSLDDIVFSVGCEEEELESVDDYVARMRKTHAHIKSTMETWRLRDVAETEFRHGRPANAAALLSSTSLWNNPGWRPQKLGTDAYAATFYAAYGEYDLASSHLSAANGNFGTSGGHSCSTRNNYWMSRAESYINLAQGEYGDAQSNARQAAHFLAMNKKTIDGECGRYLKPWRAAELGMLSARAAFGLGDINKAESHARKAQGVLRSPHFKKQALMLLGKIKRRQGNYQDALSYGLLAREIRMWGYCPAASSPINVENNRDIALALTALKRFDSAYSVLQRVEKDLKNNQVLWNNLFANTVDRGIILRETGRVREAKTVFQAATQQLSNQYGGNHYRAAEAAMMATLTDSSVPVSKLTTDLRRLLSLWQAGVGQLAHGQSNQSIVLKWIVEDYLARVFDGNNDPAILADAFEITETLRSGMVQQALMQTALRRLAPDEKTRDLIRRQQDMQNKLVVMRQQLGQDAALGQVKFETVQKLKTIVGHTESAVALLADQVRAAIPEYDEVTSSGGFDLKRAIKALNPGEAVVSLTSGRRHSFVWVVGSSGNVSGQMINKTAADWEKDVAVLRDSMELGAGGLKTLLDFDSATAHGIYQDLLAPLESNWSSAKHLIFVSDNVLSTLPMGMLLTKPTLPDSSGVLFSGFKRMPWLLRSHAISMAPSFTSLVLLRQGGKSANSRLTFLGIGDPIFNPTEAALEVANLGQTRGQFKLRSLSTTRQLDSAALANLPRLRDTADEVKAIGAVLGANSKRDIFVGSRASEATIRKMSRSGALKKYRVISFATHGLIPGDLDGLASPALALSAPSAKSKDKWDDGLLTADEIMELDLDADWAILSACNTASAQSSSTEAFSGLGRAFFYAGARSLLLSNWPVFSDSTRQLMVSVFKHEKTTPSRAQALQAAALDIMDNSGIDRGPGFQFSYAHPLFWAPFTLVGDGG
jgi:CHAT domain-containing protein/tetratricopeptide (TPR) repeat protein